MLMPIMLSKETIFALLFLSCCSTKLMTGGQSVVTETFLMPNAQPTKEDHYICTSKPVADEDSYIVSYKALASGEVAHHMLLFACNEPYGPDGELWDCGMICADGTSTIVYAWARNAPPTNLPPDVGYHIGGSSNFKHLVLQIHYKKPSTEPDRSGVQLGITMQEPKYQAGVALLLSNFGSIPPRQHVAHLDVACKYDGTTDLHPFGFRTHAHWLSRVITGYQVNGSYHLIGRGNPQWPQAFYPVEDDIVIKPDDYMAARCTYDSTSVDHVVEIGDTHNDEMCNFYIMYYTEQGGQKSFFCYSNEEKDIIKNLPIDSDVPPPVNHKLEATGEGTGDQHFKDQEIKQVEDWPFFADFKFGQIGGITVLSNGYVVVFHRASRRWDFESFDDLNNIRDKTPIQKTTLSLLSTQGKVLKSWGSNMFYMPHGISNDADDNIWITDVGLHQVMKFDAGTEKSDPYEPSLTLGNKLKPGSDDDSFCKPTDIAVLKSGEFFVADGYCNSRIMKFSATGKLLMSWGTASESVGANFQPPPTTFQIPHSLALLEDKDELCVADRENGRVLCFTTSGKFQHQVNSWGAPARVFAISYSKPKELLLVVTQTEEGDGAGYTVSTREWKVVEEWSVPQEFAEPHDVQVDPLGDSLYVSGLHTTHNLWKFDVNWNKPKGKSIKKTGHHHPASIDNALDEETEEEIEEKEGGEEADFNASLVIGALLIIPIIVIVSIALFLRLRKNAVWGSQGYFKVMAFEDDDLEAS